MSSASSNVSAVTAFTTIFSLISALEDIGDVFSALSSQSEATSKFYMAPEYARSQITVAPNDSASQVTVKGLPSDIVKSAPSTATGAERVNKASGGNYGGMEPDKEGKETRQALLKRRRLECKAEEVDVALAPVLKINVPYVLYPDQYRRFRALFPRINVDSGLSYTHHDHPVAHTATMVGIRRMQGMLQPGEKVLDLHGNPNGNEQFNRFQAARARKRPNLPAPPVIETMVQMKTAGDAVRKVTKWGPQYDVTTKAERWWQGDLSDIYDSRYDVFLSAHTLYYYSMYEVCKLMNKNPHARMIALVNYSPEQSGTLYGELKFSKQDGMTTQTSPNGEKYYHPDIDQWFQTNSFRGLTETIDSGISWTSTNIGGPLYIITIAKCDWQQARHHKYMPPMAPTLKVTGERTFLGMVRVGGTDVRLRITNLELASELRHFMTFRDRNNPQTFLDLCVKARRITGKDIVEGSREYYVNDGELQDHIVYAYVVDAPGELEILEGVKLLRGDVLEKLSQSLKFEGDSKKTPIIECIPFIKSFIGRSTTKQSLSGRTTAKGIGAFEQTTQNSGGLLPTKRT